MAHPGGRPRIYDDPEELDREVVKYFSQESLLKPTVTGLTLWLGFADKTTLYDYRDKPEFSHSIKRGLTLIEMYHEEGLSENNVAGRIFALKNMGWKDRTEQDLNVSGDLKMIWHEEKTYISPEGPMETKGTLHTKGGDVPR